MWFHDYIISSFDICDQNVFIFHVDVEFFLQSLMNVDSILNICLNKIYYEVKISANPSSFMKFVLKVIGTEFHLSGSTLRRR